MSALVPNIGTFGGLDVETRDITDTMGDKQVCLIEYFLWLIKLVV